MTRCPCCGQSVDTDDLLVSLDANKVSRRGIVIALVPQEAEVLWALNRGRPGITTHEHLFAVLYGSGSKAMQSGMMVKVLISHLRRHLSALGVRIESVHSEGYRMVVE